MMPSPSQIMLIVELILRLLEASDELRKLLERIQAGEDISNEELEKGLADAEAAIKRIKGT